MSFKIAQISDCHLFADKQQIGYQGINPYLSLQSILGDIALNCPDLVVASGDISADESQSSYKHFSRLWRDSQISAPLLVIPGNHDHLAYLDNVLNASAGWPVSRSAGQFWQLHGLNTKSNGSGGALSMMQLDYISEQVTANPHSHHLFVVHHHPYACGGWMDNHAWDNSDEFLARVREHKQIKAVIYGHIHHASELQKGHSLYMSAPSTCWQWANSDSFAATDEAPGYRLIILADNGHLDSNIIRI